MPPETDNETVRVGGDKEPDSAVSGTTTLSRIASPPADGIGSWGRLRLLEKLGAGSFGEVYRAWDPELDREVALKLLRAGLPNGDEAVAEGRMLARVRHPNVLSIFGAARLDGRVGLWMEFVKGRTLAQVLIDQGPLGAREATLVGMDLCRALAAVHAAGVIHRDVKAHNVMREEGGRILLTDFGAGVHANGPDLLPGDVSGTPLYMAPEAFDGSATRSTDLYSLGVLLFHLVSGEYPVQGSTIAEIRETHRSPRRRRLRDVRPDLPEDFIRVVEKAIEPRPEDRYESAGAFETALSTVLGRVDPVARVPPVKSRQRLAVAALVVAVAVTLGIVLWFSAGNSSNPGRGGPTTIEHSPVAAVPSLAVEARLLRRRGARLDPVTTGGDLKVNDGLLLEISSNQPMYVYLANEDDAGHAYLLFPLPGAHRNPLPAGGPHRLPGVIDGLERQWQVTSAGGRERVLLVASPERLDDLEASLAQLPRPAAGQLAAPWGRPWRRASGASAVSRPRSRPALRDESRDSPRSRAKEASSRTCGSRPTSSPTPGRLADDPGARRVRRSMHVDRPSCFELRRIQRRQSNQPDSGVTAPGDESDSCSADDDHPAAQRRQSGTRDPVPDHAAEWTRALDDRSQPLPEHRSRRRLAPVPF